MQIVPRARLARRDDREQLAELVNAHLSAVIPGARVSVNTVLASLERQPDEYVVDPWVVERVTIVVEQLDRVVAAAHLQRFADRPAVSEDYRGAGLVQWFLVIPEEDAAADALLRACLAQLAAWDVRIAYADGQLPFPGVYGVPESWPHVRAALERGGFVWDGPAETVLLATTASLPDPALLASEGLAVRRTLGAAGVRFAAERDGSELGSLELDLGAGRAERHAAGVGIAELSDWDVDDEADDSVLPWLLAQARAWLELSEVRRLLVAEDADDAESLERLTGLGFRELVTTARGWRRAIR